jgi:hypothetical protein
MFRVNSRRIATRKPRAARKPNYAAHVNELPRLTN